MQGQRQPSVITTAGLSHMLLSSPVMLTLAAAEGNNTRLLEHCPDSPWKHRRYTRFYTTQSLERTHEHQPSPGFCFQLEREELIVEGIYWLQFIKKKYDTRVDTLIPAPFVTRFKFERVKKILKSSHCNNVGGLHATFLL